MTRGRGPTVSAGGHRKSLTNFDQLGETRFMKHVLAIVGTILVLVGGGGFYMLPRLVDRRLNRVLEVPPYPVREEVRSWYRTLFVADLHADTLLWPRALLHEADHGHVDVPRLERGGVALQVFTAVTKVPAGLNYESNDARSDMVRWLVISQGWPWSTWNSLFERAVYQANRLEQASAASSGRLRVIRSRQDLDALLSERERGRSVVGAVLGVEGLHCLEGRLENVDRLYAAGFRVLGLTHFFDNELGGSAHGQRKGGLTGFGADVVRRAEERKMIVDLAHASPKLFDDVIAMVRRPPIVSHTGVKGTCDTVRNLSDDQLRAVAAKGGIVGIGYWDGAVCQPTMANIARAIVYAVQLIGAEHVALGSDFDGGTTTPFDTTGLVQVAQALLDSGLTREEVRAVFGGNVQRLLSALLP
ncbi:MAG: dipeptidase [Candidatus Binatia bacterium]|nr:MAG: dipeptidase [Candidatus Binatia bacterium]